MVGSHVDREASAPGSRASGAPPRRRLAAVLRRGDGAMPFVPAAGFVAAIAYCAFLTRWGAEGWRVALAVVAGAVTAVALTTWLLSHRLRTLAARHEAAAARLARVNAALRTLPTAPGLDTTLSSIMETARRTLRAEHVVIHVRHGDHLVLGAGHVWVDEWDRERVARHTRAELATGNGTPLACTCNHGETVVVRDIFDEPRFPDWSRRFRDTVRFEQLRSMITVPLRVDDEIIGAIVAFFAGPDRLEDDLVAVLQTYAEHAALAILRSQAYERERELAARLAEADEMKTAFLALVSHELRTPLTAAKGFVDTVLHQWDKLDDDRKRAMLDRASENADALSSMIEQLLTFSRMESAALRPHVEHRLLRPVVEHEVERLAPVLAGHEVRVAVADDVGAAIDPALLRPVLENLLANAVRFAPAGTAITIAATEACGETAIEVSDEGPGIALDEHDRIFERFYQGRGLPAPARRGAGLGLAIARVCVEAMGGRIWVESEPGAGATFVVALPEHPGPPAGLTLRDVPAKLDQSV